MVAIAAGIKIAGGAPVMSFTTGRRDTVTIGTEVILPIMAMAALRYWVYCWAIPDTIILDIAVDIITGARVIGTITNGGNTSNIIGAGIEIDQKLQYG
jgi:hypothetical protein